MSWSFPIGFFQSEKPSYLRDLPEGREVGLVPLFCTSRLWVCDNEWGWFFSLSWSWTRPWHPPQEDWWEKAVRTIWLLVGKKWESSVSLRTSLVGSFHPSSEHYSPLLELMSMRTQKARRIRFSEIQEDCPSHICVWARCPAHLAGLGAQCQGGYLQVIFNMGRMGASLVAQWLRICLPMQGTRVRAVVREDPTCYGATKPLHHNYWACALEPTSHNYWNPRATTTEPACHNYLSPCATTEAHAPRAHALQQEKPPQCEARAPQRRVAPSRHN